MSDETSAHREHFKLVTSSGTPVYLGGGDRISIYIFNEGPDNVRLCNSSGTVYTLGVLLPSGTWLTDPFSDDSYWAGATSSSGTVSGFIVRE